MSHPSAADRAAARATWPIRVVPLAQADREGDLLLHLTPAERVALVWTLSARMWELTGQDRQPSHRSAAPISIRSLQ